MQTDNLYQLAAQPVDDETKAAIEEAQAEARRGEVVSLEQAKILIRKQNKAWRKTQQEILTA